MDKDIEMLKDLGDAVIGLQSKYRGLSLNDRMAIRPELERLLNSYAVYQVRLLKGGVITTDKDLHEMADIRDEIDSAAEKEMILKIVAKTIAFIAVRV